MNSSGIQRQRLLAVLAVVVVSGVLLAAAVAAILLYQSLSQPATQVELPGLSPDLSQDGVVITFVQSGSPAEQAGLQRGDIILSVAGEQVNGREMLRQVVNRQVVGSQVLLAVLHGDELRNVVVTLAQEPPLLGVDGAGANEAPVAGPANGPLPNQPLPGAPAPEGNQPGQLSPDPPAIVVDVLPDSPAAAAGLQRQDVIVAVDGQQVRLARELVLLILVHAPGDSLPVTVQRQGVTVTMTVTLVAHPDGSGKAYLGVRLPSFSQ